MKSRTVCTFLFVMTSFSLLLPAQVFLNLGFEYALPGSITPEKWFIGRDQHYNIQLDSTEQSQDTYSLKISATSSAERSFGVATGNFPVATARDKEILMTGCIKTEKLEEGFAGLWLRIDGPEGVLAFDNMAKLAIKGDNEWATYEIKLKVPANAININFGVLHTGTGDAWFDQIEFRVDGLLYDSPSPLRRKPTKGEVAWLKARIIPLSTTSPEVPMGEELQALKDDFRQARVIALGEVTHGSREIFAMKHRLIRYLCQEENFSRFALEANLPEAYAVNRYLAGDTQQSVTSLLRNMYFWTWQTEEVAALVEWMKLHNEKEGQRIEFTGFDMQYYQGAIVELSRVLKEDELTTIITLLSDLRNARKNQGNRNELSTEQMEAFETAFSRLRKLLKANNLEAQKLSWANQQVRILEQYVQMKGYLSRDRFMAENMRWIYDQSPEEKVVIWAHNGHIQESDQRMGKYLHDNFGQDYLSIGFTFYQGAYTAKGDEGLKSYRAQTAYPGTYEYFFNAVDEPIFLLDLRDIDRNEEAAKWIFTNLPFRSVGAVKRTQEFNDAALYDDFDLILFIKDSTPSQLLTK